MQPTETLVESPPRHMRPSLREQDPRAAAAERAKELLEHAGSLDEGSDKFYIDQAIIPPGWTYEWKRHSTYGKEDPSYAVNLARTGWEPVPITRHPEMMPEGWRGSIVVDGLILMERPLEITEIVKNRERRAARDQVRIKQEQLSNAAVAGLPPGFDTTNKGAALATFKKTVEPMTIPQ